MQNCYLAVTYCSRPKPPTFISGLLNVVVDDNDDEFPNKIMPNKMLNLLYRKFCFLFK